MPHSMNKIDTLIGRTVRLQGDLEFSGGLHLDGWIAGDVRAASSLNSTLSVSEHGRIEGAVEVANVFLEGTVMGPIRARERVVLGAKARVHGDVYYGVIEMTLGAEILGKLVPIAVPEPARAAQPAKLQAKLA
jgi:cytoskeletal protein CcmA (bactofilin family)